MIRTFITYTLIDKCLDLLFDRIEMAFVPFDGCRVGDRYRRIVIRNSNCNYDLITTFHKCEVTSISTFVDISCEYSEVVHIFKNSYAAHEYMDKKTISEDDIECNVSDDGLTVTEMRTTSGAWIKPESFLTAEKFK